MGMRTRRAGRYTRRPGVSTFVRAPFHLAARLDAGGARAICSAWLHLLAPGAQPSPSRARMDGRDFGVDCLRLFGVHGSRRAPIVGRAVRATTSSRLGLLGR